MVDFKALRETARGLGGKRLAVAFPHDHDSLQAVVAAADRGLVTPVLIGEREIIAPIVEELGAGIDVFEVVEADSAEAAADTAAALVGAGEADALMKGLLDTSTVLKAVLKSEHGLRSGRLLSHVAVFCVPNYPRLLLVSDAAMNIAPTVEQKREIIENAVDVAQALGIATPKVAMLCAKEKEDSKMPATVDAATLAKLNRDGGLTGCKVSGPLALDNAVSLEAAKQKGITDPVAGQADVLIASTIEVGNVLYKALAFLAGADTAGLIVGARAPVVLTSRADSTAVKLDSIALAAVYAAHCNRSEPAGF